MIWRKYDVILNITKMLQHLIITSSKTLNRSPWQQPILKTVLEMIHQPQIYILQIHGKKMYQPINHHNKMEWKQSESKFIKLELRDEICQSLNKTALSFITMGIVPSNPTALNPTIYKMDFTQNQMAIEKKERAKTTTTTNFPQVIGFLRKLTLRVPAARSGWKIAHLSCLVFGYIIASFLRSD